MEATGVHGWNDPIDPDGGSRRPEPPTHDPAWLTDRPAPRSPYLFGDEPQRPSDGWDRDQPTEQWRATDPAASYQQDTGRHYQDGGRHHDNGRYQATEPAGGHYEPSTDGWATDRFTGMVDHPTAPHAVDRTAYHSTPQAGAYDLGAYETPGQQYTGQLGRYAEPDPWPGFGTPDASTAVVGTDHQDTEPARTRGRSRRLRRPLVMGGAAAAATLVVSIGVAALALPGDDGPTGTTAGEASAATTPALPSEDEVVPFDSLDTESPSPSPSVSPSTASPSPSRTTKPEPTPARSTAASRVAGDRQGSPSRGATASPSTASPSTPSPSTTSGATSETTRVVELVNAERAKAGCEAVSIDQKLTTAAQRHSQDQADHQNMSHTGSDGSEPRERIDRVGYVWRTFGENVAWNQQTPAAVMDAWMNSDGHRANILNCSFTEIGVGVASSNGPYWTQVFAAPR
ncbi:CAP domain-containing protein [Micromonospora sp. LOL_024]|uniref:CAP domain-containing protein n=1 Tax=Micromonospora sp. LOL_024 TaxID=3345412 RepID=UPI003A89E897